MSDDNLISIKSFVDRKDLEAFVKSLMEQHTKLQIELQNAKDKIEHLEELLISSESIMDLSCLKKG